MLRIISCLTDFYKITCLITKPNVVKWSTGGRERERERERERGQHIEKLNISCLKHYPKFTIRPGKLQHA